MNKIEHSQSDVMLVSDIANDLGMTRGSVIKHIDSGELKAYRLGKRGHWRVQRADYEAFKRKHIVTNQDPG